MDLTASVSERFLRYVSIDTRSSEESGLHPSTPGQFDLARLLEKELEQVADDVYFDVEHCYIYAHIRGLETLPRIGFIAHMDTSPEACGAGIKVIRHEDYDGGDITLPSGKVLSPSEFPELLDYVGQTILTSDGSTLLGSDDKSGIAEIMTMASYIHDHPEIRHGDISIAFTPDEEIGEGTEFFDLDRFAADYAYTVDGGIIGEISYENFNAAGADITITGRNVHPGEAYGKMINALRVAEEIDGMIPGTERPETTREYEGFYHLISLTGSPEQAVMKYIIRDHDRSLFEEKKARLVSICNDVSAGTGAVIKPEIRDSYYNMREKIVPDRMHIVNDCIAAMERAGINPLIMPIRGGTDGAMLSYKGLACPNICAGGHNFHGVYEYVSEQSMGRISELLIEIVKGAGYEEDQTGNRLDTHLRAAGIM